MMRYLGETAKFIRTGLGLTQAAMARQLDISIVQLSKIENDHAMPSPQLIYRYEQISGINPYVADWCRNPQTEKLPTEVREAAESLYRIWSDELKK
jgi:transcriptional regulator with XRE-family HTH domain